MKQKTVKMADSTEWRPECCENCGLLFDAGTWEGNYTLSGEYAWTCPKCGHVAYPQI